ncbi:MAG: hypothetical protein HYZ54_14375 [Ignavibacteriae bacterium]|nr:hypothetical protein [Ignavibacteriota bacterium]
MMNLKTCIPILIILILLLQWSNCANEKNRTIQNIPVNVANTGIDIKISGFLSDLKKGKFEICYSDNNIPQSLKDIIDPYCKYSNTGIFRSRLGMKDFDKMFTFDREKCNLTCYIDDTTCWGLMQYCIVSDNYFGVSFLSGGLDTTHWFMIFHITNSKVLSHCIVKFNFESETHSPSDLGLTLTKGNLIMFEKLVCGTHKLPCNSNELSP